MTTPSAWAPGERPPVARARWRIAWLILRNDLRMFWRGSTRTKLRWATSGIGRVLMIALLHLPALGLVATFTRQPSDEGGAELACLFAALFVFMLALQRSVETLYNRGDLPFLLASPAPRDVVLTTRLGDVVLATVLGTAPIVLPLVDAGLILVHGRWAWGWAAWILAALVLSPLALLVTLVVVERIGARRARTAIQVFALLLAVATMLAVQMPHWLAERGVPGAADAARVEFAVHFATPPLTWLAAAASGDPRWLGALALTAVVALGLARLGLARAFTRGAQSAAGDLGEWRRRRSPSRAAWQRLFRGSRRRRVLLKELRVLRRDPLLIARCSMQLVALMPMLVGTLLVNEAVGIAGLAFLAPSMLTVTLAAVMNANDDAHEFVAASPLTAREAAAARATAAASPTALLGVLLAGVMVLRDGPRLALPTAVGAVWLALAMGWLATCTTPVLGPEERARQKPPRLFGQSLLGMALGGVATTGILVGERGHGGLGAALFVGTLAAASLLFLVSPRRAAHDG